MMRDQDTLERLAAIMNRMQALALDVSRLQQTVARLDRVQPRAAFAIVVSPTADATGVQCSQCYVHAGEYAEYDYPQEGDGPASVAALADGHYLAFMDIAVDPSYGYFTDNYKPVLKVDKLASEHHDLQAEDHVHVVLADVWVTGGKVTNVRPRPVTDIRCDVLVDAGSAIDSTSKELTAYSYRACQKQYGFPEKAQSFVTGVSVDEAAGHSHTVTLTTGEAFQYFIFSEPKTGGPTEKCH